MFPPLCFVDESKAEVEYDETEEKINSKRNNSNLDLGISSDKNKSDKLENIDKESNKNDIQIKFKTVEILKSLFN